MPIKFFAETGEDYLYWEIIDKAERMRINILLCEVQCLAVGEIKNSRAFKLQPVNSWSRRNNDERHLFSHARRLCDGRAVP